MVRYTCLSDTGDPDAAEPFLRESSRVQAVVAYFPPADLERWGTPATRETFPAVALDPASAREYSPIHYVSADDAPALLLHGDADALVPILESETMYQALSEGGVVSELVAIEGSGHGFNGNGAMRANRAMVAWFKRHLGGE